jgi:hypothetical protein
MTMSRSKWIVTANCAQLAFLNSGAFLATSLLKVPRSETPPEIRSRGVVLPALTTLSCSRTWPSLGTCKAAKYPTVALKR